MVARVAGLDLAYIQGTHRAANRLTTYIAAARMHFFYKYPRWFRKIKPHSDSKYNGSDHTGSEAKPLTSYRNKAFHVSPSLAQA